MIKRNITAVIILIIISAPVILSQGQPDALKPEAKKEMQVGRYGEAIDLLNRYISAHPQEAEGYNLRGLCYEKRAQYEMAVYDFRSARKLLPQNTEINQNLSRTTEAWYKLLYNKIEGHKREIALFPKAANNYLEIGKSYKNLGEWLTAEEWYDKYLALEHASPDEIIRYTEILAKNNHIQKGEPILKKYTEQYPTDQRLWSRYGYFELWLGKNKNAIFAFEKALAIKPYFKEAMDGLDQAKGKGYIYTVNDTSYRYGKVPRAQKQQEFAIDKYYKILKNKPDDNETRFALVDELVKHDRIEEASQQLEFLQSKEEVANTDRFKDKLNYINNFRDSVYKAEIITYAGRFEKNNGDKEAATKLANSYEHLYDYDSAIDVLEKYLATVKENEDLDLRFLIAKYSGWSRKWDKAFNQTAILMKYAPDNKAYQLFNAQLIGWNILDAQPEEVEKAKGYLNDILKDDPNNLHALLSMCLIYAGKGHIPEATEYLNRAKIVAPGAKDVEAIENNINTRALVENEREILMMRGAAGKFYEEGNFNAAADKYEEIMSKLESPEKNILLEYAAFNTSAKRYDAAIKAYDRALQFGPDFEVSSLKAINYLEAGDSTKALEELNSLKIQSPNDFTVNFYLGDTYEKLKRNDDAVNLYESLIDANGKNGVTFDSSQINVFQTRLGYMKAGSGLYGGSLFSYISLAPITTIYSDNQYFTFTSFGGRIETGVVKFLSVGATYMRYNLNTKGNTSNLTSFLGHAILSMDHFTASIGMGTTRTNFGIPKNVLQLAARYEKKSLYGFGFSFEQNDARVLLFSPFLLYSNINASLLRISGNYNLPNNFILSGYFSYINIRDDNNAGNDFQIRAGKSVEDDIKVGYEFYYANFSRNSGLYYSPLNFSSHSIWGDWTAYRDQEFSLNFGGKLGYVPANDFILREIYEGAIYHPIPILTVTERISYSSSYRFDSSYSFWAGFITAYLSIF
jgi:tetratricopeptide (TPR) repeat protein